MGHWLFWALFLFSLMRNLHEAVITDSLQKFDLIKSHYICWELVSGLVDEACTSTFLPSLGPKEMIDNE